MSLACLCNTFWMASCYREARAYLRDSHPVHAAQANLRQRIRAENQATWFGRQHAFSSLRSPGDFQRAVPLSTYDDYTGAVERISAGEQRVLTADRVRLFEPTGGSTSGEKLIP